MDPFVKPKTSSSQVKPGSINPLAQSLAETERGYNTQPNPNAQGNSLFGEALARTGGQMDNFDQNDPAAMERQREEWEKQQKKEALRRRLHDQINPVDTTDVFSTRERQVLQEIEKTREELKKLADEMQLMQKEVDIAVYQQVVSPGQKGTYYFNFFHQLRQFIMLLRQKVHSARAWLQQSQAKSKKKRKRGMEFGGQQFEQTKTVFDMMHHERSNAYSGS